MPDYCKMKNELRKLFDNCRFLNPVPITKPHKKLLRLSLQTKVPFTCKPNLSQFNTSPINEIQIIMSHSMLLFVPDEVYYNSSRKTNNNKHVS